MMVEAVQYEWIPILLATAIYLILGTVWYSKFLFGPLSLRLSIPSIKPVPYAIFWTICAGFIVAFFLAFFENYLSVTTVLDGMFVGFCAWLGFVFPTQLSLVIWNQQPLPLFWIHAGYRLLAFVSMAGFLGA